MAKHKTSNKIELEIPTHYVNSFTSAFSETKSSIRLENPDEAVNPISIKDNKIIVNPESSKNELLNGCIAYINNFIQTKSQEDNIKMLKAFNNMYLALKNIVESSSKIDDKLLTKALEAIKQAERLIF